MASLRYAKGRAQAKSRQVYRSNKYKPKRVILKKFANFVGKATFKTARKSRSGSPRRRMFRRISNYRRMRY